MNQEELIQALYEANHELALAKSRQELLRKQLLEVLPPQPQEIFARGLRLRITHVKSFRAKPKATQFFREQFPDMYTETTTTRVQIQPDSEEI